MLLITPLTILDRVTAATSYSQTKPGQIPLSIHGVNGVISDRTNRDKNAVCLLLYFCNILIQDWYHEIIDKFNPLIVKEAPTSNRKLTAIEPAILTEFIKRTFSQESGKFVKKSIRTIR